MLGLGLAAVPKVTSGLPLGVAVMCPAILLQTIIIESGAFGELLGAFLFTSFLSRS